jgi:opacity protein-like surface antigen
MKKIASIIALATATLATPFLAYAEGTYVKASIGQSNYKGDGGNEHATGGSLGLGYVIDKNWDAEIGYNNFGTIKSTELTPQLSFKTQTIYAAGIGKLPVTDALSVFGKAGVAFNYSKLSVVGLPLEASKTNTALLLLGTGLNYQFTKELAASVDYTYYGKGKVTVEGETGDFKLDQVSAGLKYYF